MGLERLRGLRRLVMRMGLTIGVTILTLLLWTKGLWPQRFVWAPLSGEAVFCVSTQAPIMALTFDDGPHPVYTPAILDLLRDYQAKATFFAIGQHLAQYPDIAQTLVAQGHELANHTFSHPDLNRKFRRDISQEIRRTDDLLTQWLPPLSSYFRPPYGHANLLVMQTLKSMGRPIIFWDVDVQDWNGLAVDQMFAVVERNAHPGAIVLMHDSGPTPPGSPPVDRQRTVELVQKILATYSPQGYQFVTLSDLLAQGDPRPSARHCRQPILTALLPWANASQSNSP